MIQMRGADEREATVLRQVAEEQGQSNGVRPAGERDQHTAPLRTQIMPPNSAPNPLVDR
jgi:hypothetical protein